MLNSITENLRYISQKRLIRNFTSMFTGNIMAQAMSFLLTPIITRLYTPDDFGIMTYIMTLTGLISIWVCLCYERAILLPAEEKKAESLFRLCLFFTSGVTIITILVFWGFKALIAASAGIPGIELYLFFVPLGTFIIGINSSFAQVHIRSKRFKLVAISRFIFTSTTVFSKIILALLLGASAVWLVAGNIIGYLAALVLLMRFYFKYRNNLEPNFLNIDSMWEVAKEYNKFPKYVLPTEIFNSISQSLPVILFAALFSPEVVGFYGLANSMLRRPLDLLYSSLSEVFLQKAAEINNYGGDLFHLQKKTTRVLFLIGIIPFGILTAFGDKIFIFVFGQQWQTAGVCAQILAPWLFIGFINNPANQIIIVKQALRFKFILELLYIVFSFAGIYVGYYFFPFDFKMSVAIFSFIGFSRGLVLNYAGVVFSRKP